MLKGLFVSLTGSVVNDKGSNIIVHHFVKVKCLITKLQKLKKKVSFLEDRTK